MAKKYYAEQCEKNSEVLYVRLIDYDFERAKVDRLQVALQDAIKLINISTQERQVRVEELTALANMPR